VALGVGAGLGLGILQQDSTIHHFLHLEVRAAILVALALLTPSTGLILDSIDQIGPGPQETRWVELKAIATEMLALLVLFAVLQSTTPARLGISVAVLVVLAAMVPLRVLTVVLHRRVALRESTSSGVRVAIAMLPTLVFGLVLAKILRDRFAVSPTIFGGLILYTLVTTIFPVVVFRRALPDDDMPHVPELQEAAPDPGIQA
jgi:Kef-type K+ transport system membrane component KefB